MFLRQCAHQEFIFLLLTLNLFLPFFLQVPKSLSKGRFNLSLFFLVLLFHFLEVELLDILLKLLNIFPALLGKDILALHAELVRPDLELLEFILLFLLILMNEGGRFEHVLEIAIKFF